MRKIILNITYSIFLLLAGCNDSDLGTKGIKEYDNYIELNAVKFVIDEVLSDLPKYLSKNKLEATKRVLDSVTNLNIYLATRVCKWTPQFGDFDYPLNLPSFECYKIPTSNVDYINLIDVDSFKIESKQYLMVVSRPLVYQWGGYIEVIIYSEKFGIDNPVFFIVQKDNQMYLHSMGGISGFPVR